MWLSLLSKILASLLVATLSSAIITSVTNQTILNSHYLESQVAAVHGYDRFSGALSDELARTPALAAYPSAAAALQPILSPAVIQQKVNAALDQLQAYYRGTGPRPVIDLTDLAAQAQAAGVPVPPDSSLTKPIPLSSSNPSSRNVAKAVAGLQPLTVITSIVLALLLAVVAWRRRQFKPLPNVLISVGVLIGLVALLLQTGASLADHFIKLGTASPAFVSLGHDLADRIVRDMAHRFGIIALVLLVAGIVARIWIGRLQAKQARNVAPSTPANGTIR